MIEVKRRYIAFQKAGAMIDQESDSAEERLLLFLFKIGKQSPEE